MSTPDINYAQQFEDTFHLLTQIQGGKIAPNMYNKQYTNAESVFYDQLGAVSEDERGERFSRTNYKDIARFRRKLSVDDFNLALQIDKPDENRTLADVRNPYVRQTAQAWRRSRDITACKAALGITYSGKNGTTANDFDWTNQKVDVTTGSTASTGLNTAKLIEGKGIFWGNDVDLDDPMYELHLVISAKQAEDLMNDDKFINNDYNVKTLQNGEIVNYMGYKIHMSNLLPYMATSGSAVNLDWAENATFGYNQPVDTDSTDVRACFAWAKDMVCVADNKSYKVRAEELQDYNYNFGIYTEWGIGGMRHEEKGVVAIPCDESPA